MIYTTNNLKKIEDMIKDFGYELRYEKGNFNAGFCLLESKKVLVINKYFTQDVRFQKLLELLPLLDLTMDKLTSDIHRKKFEKLQSQLYIPNSIPFDNNEK